MATLCYEIELGKQPHSLWFELWYCEVVWCRAERLIVASSPRVTYFEHVFFVLRKCVRELLIWNMCFSSYMSVYQNPIRMCSSRIENDCNSLEVYNPKRISLNYPFSYLNQETFVRNHIPMLPCVFASVFIAGTMR